MKQIDYVAHKLTNYLKNVNQGGVDNLCANEKKRRILVYVNNLEYEHPHGQSVQGVEYKAIPPRADGNGYHLISC